MVDLKETPITEITSTGVKTADGKIHELDVIVFATGFDAVDGNYTRVAIRGRNGHTLKEHWSEAGPTSYLGISVPEFPNLFMILGPNGPFTNLPPTIETQVEFISDVIENAESRPGKGEQEEDHPHSSSSVIEATHGAEEDWTELCDNLSAGSLFRKTDSWIFGANVPGKKPAVMFYFGGLGSYRKALADVVANGFRGFKLSS